MKKVFQTRRILKIYVDEGEYKWVELQAGGNISQWCRERILSGCEVVLEPRKAAVKAVRQGPACEHGVRKGYHCWQCGGIAKA